MHFRPIWSSGWEFPGRKAVNRRRNILSRPLKECRLSIVAISLLLTNAFAEEELQLSADRRTIQAGESCKLTWSTTGNTAFLTNVGKVAPSGSAVVFPPRTTEYILLAEEQGKLSSTSLEVTVEGQKGDSGFPDPSDFGKEGIFGDQHWGVYLDFVDAAWKLLQNMSFHVRGITLPKGATDFTVYTDRQPTKDLKSSSDRGVRERRFAYLLTAHAPSADDRSSAKFEIRTLVDFRLVGEAGWHEETNPEVIRTAESQLLKKLPLSPSAESQ